GSSTRHRRSISSLNQRRWNRSHTRKAFRLSNRWPKQHQPLSLRQANPSRFELPHTRKRFHIPTRKPPQNPFQQNRKFYNSNRSGGDDLKKVSRPSSKAKISTSRPTCGKTSR